MEESPNTFTAFISKLSGIICKNNIIEYLPYKHLIFTDNEIKFPDKSLLPWSLDDKFPDERALSIRKT